MSLSPQSGAPGGARPQPAHPLGPSATDASGATVALCSATYSPEAWWTKGAMSVCICVHKTASNAMMPLHTCNVSSHWLRRAKALDRTRPVGAYQAFDGVRADWLPSCAPSDEVTPMQVADAIDISAFRLDRLSVPKK
jgi:hypothetical protein